MENQKASKTFLCANLHLHTIHHLLWSMGPEKEKATQTLLSTSLYFIWSTGARKKKKTSHHLLWSKGAKKEKTSQTFIFSCRHLHHFWTSQKTEFLTTF